MSVTLHLADRCTGQVWHILRSLIFHLCPPCGPPPTPISSALTVDHRDRSGHHLLLPLFRMALVTSPFSVSSKSSNGSPISKTKAKVGPGPTQGFLVCFGSSSSTWNLIEMVLWLQP